jgi:hypothetical protein
MPELRVLRIPVLATALGLPGWFSTLKKSALKRSIILSRIGMALNKEASNPHCRELGRYWLRHGCRLSLYVVR